MSWKARCGPHATHNQAVGNGLGALCGVRPDCAELLNEPGDAIWHVSGGFGSLFQVGFILLPIEGKTGTVKMMVRSAGIVTQRAGGSCPGCSTDKKRTGQPPVQPLSDEAALLEGLAIVH